MSNAAFSLALPRRKTQMPIQGVRKNVRQANRANRHIYHTEAVTLRLSTLHVEDRHHHRKHENCRRKSNRIPQSVRVTSKMRPVLRTPERATTRCTVARRVLALPESAPMQPTQIDALAAQRRLPLPYIQPETLREL
jgi:hypothetical protein